MSKQVVQMHYESMLKVSKAFKQCSDMLVNVGKVLVKQFERLVGAYGDQRSGRPRPGMLSNRAVAAYQRYLQNLIPKVERVAKLCNEFSTDLAAAVEDHKKGDVAGKRYFGEGIQRG